MKSIVIGLVVALAVFTFVGALNTSPLSPRPVPVQAAPPQAHP